MDRNFIKDMLKIYNKRGMICSLIVKRLKINKKEIKAWGMKNHNLSRVIIIYNPNFFSFLSQCALGEVTWGMFEMASGRGKKVTTTVEDKAQMQVTNALDLVGQDQWPVLLGPKTPILNTKTPDLNSMIVKGIITTDQPIGENAPTKNLVYLVIEMKYVCIE